VKLEAAIVGADGTDAEVLTDLVQAQHLQPGMLHHDPESGEVFIVAADPEPYLAGEGRPERWVNVALAGAEQPLSAPATARVHVVFGAEPDALQPLLDADLYDAAEEALASNGMCPERLEPDADGEPRWCGLPSDQDSYYRLCSDHDADRREESDDLVHRGYQPSYGTVAELAP
jgi:hypothetical protein